MSDFIDALPDQFNMNGSFDAEMPELAAERAAVIRQVRSPIKVAASGRFTMILTAAFVVWAERDGIVPSLIACHAEPRDINGCGYDFRATPEELNLNA